MMRRAGVVRPWYDGYAAARELPNGLDAAVQELTFGRGRLVVLDRYEVVQSGW